MPGLRVLLVASEVAGFAKTGGLADVAAALPRALAKLGNQVAIVMPYYAAIRRSGIAAERLPFTLPVPMGTKLLACRVFRARLPNSDVPVYLVEHSPYFDRDDPAAGRSLYQHQLADGRRVDYADNAERYVFLSRAALELVPLIGFAPDVIHANDWQTGLVPVLLSEIYRDKPGYQKLRSVFTIHNIAYQGVFNRPVMNITGLSPALYNPSQLEFNGYASFLKGGIVFADAVTTVSPTYAREVQRAEFGYGMEGLLSSLHGKLTGIVNGCDYAQWDPATDHFLAAPYSSATVFENKPACKAELQRRCFLPENPDAPLLAMVARLVSQKGIDLVLEAAPGFLDLGCQLVILGEGDPEYQWQVQALRDRHPDRVGIYLGFNDSLAHAIEAGSDLFLMPSRYEPCGLNQMYSLRYGTPPVVRATGGLADTVVNATLENLADRRATGFSFQEYSSRALYETVRWALTLFRVQPADFRQVVLTGMAQDWSWDRSAAAYEALYRKVTG